MEVNKLLLLLILILISSAVVYAQFEFEHDHEFELDPEYEPLEETVVVALGGDVWLSPGGDTAMYSAYGISYGGSFAIGYGRGTSIGIKGFWFFSPEGINTLELNILFRIYFLGAQAHSGPFIQIMGGPALFFIQDSEFSFPAKLGMISGGLCFGWRFLLGRNLFFEPSIRGGYPYFAGAGLAAGVRF